MEAVIQRFRGALNGFNRQDVQDYIEQQTAAHKQELGELQKRLDKAEGQLVELQDVRDEASKVKASLDASTRMVTRLKGELSQSESKLSVAKKELERLQARVAALEPLAASYREIRDRAANVELDAHHRAREAVSEARAEAERVRADTRRWLASVLEQYDQLRRSMEQMLAQAKAVVGAGERLEPMDAAAQRLKKLGTPKEASAVKREQEAVK